MERAHIAPAMLVVEDEDDSRDILVQILRFKYSGLVILEASDGKGAIECASRSHPQVVITDVNLPDTDGIRLCRDIRSMDPGIRFIVISAYDSGLVQRKISDLEVSPVRFVAKPIEYAKLLVAIDECLKEIQAVAASGGNV